MVTNDYTMKPLTGRSGVVLSNRPPNHTAVRHPQSAPRFHLPVAAHQLLNLATLPCHDAKGPNPSRTRNRERPSRHTAHAKRPAEGNRKACSQLQVHAQLRTIKITTGRS